MNVLLIEDNDDDVLLVRRSLTQGGIRGRVEVVSDMTGLRCALAEGVWDAVVSDYSLPSMNALDALTVVREDDPDLPFILISGLVDIETAVAVMRSGAHDYITKDDLERIPLVLQRELADARMRRERRESLRLANSLDRINSTIHSTLDSDEIIRRVMVAASKAVRADGAFIAMRHRGDWEISHVVGLPSDLPGRRYGHDRAHVAESVARAKTVFVTRDAVREVAGDEMHHDVAGRSLVYVPLIVKGAVLGVLTFVYMENEEAFTEEAVAFAERLASSVSLALENARLYEAQQRIAEALQQSLLALPESVSGVQFAHAYSSASDSARVGGDFYDIYELEPGVVALAIGDVSGKGVEAASITALVKNVMRSHAVGGDPPGEVMTKTNQIVHKFTPLEVFVTAFFGRLDARTGEMWFCCAGHPSPLVVRRAGGVDRLGVANRLVGAFPGLFFEEDRIRMSPGDRLLLYTDGLVEARQNGKMYGSDRLEAFLAAADWDSVQGLVDGVVAELHGFTKGRLRDDLALLAVSLDPGAMRAVS